MVTQVADMHYGMGSITRCRDVTDAEFEYCSDLNTTRFLGRMIEAERPDLIAFTGNFYYFFANFQKKFAKFFV